MTEKRYIVKETYMEGINYYNSAFQCIPDYTITKEEIPTVNENEMRILLERNPNLIKEEVK